MTVYCKGRGFQNELSLRLSAPHRAETLQVRHKVEEALLEEGCGSPELLTVGRAPRSTHLSGWKTSSSWPPQRVIMAAFWSGDSGGRADGLRAEDEAESSFVAPLRIVRVLS